VRHVFRYLVSEAPRAGDTVALSDEDTRHLVRVVRRGPGDRLELTDGAGRLWPATVVATGPPATVRVEAPRPAPAPAPVVLYQGLIEGNRLDLVVEKAAELGIARVVLVTGERGRRTPAPEAAARRLERLRRLAAAAARQAGHGHLLEVEGLVPFGDALDEVRPAGGYLIDARGELALTDALGRRPASPAALFVGPEAGFSEAELGAARDAGLAACRLGPVTLRAETAALVAMSLALGASGRFGETGEGAPH
jgi:16S rRNA (uracil1498-N3)-methyltransferase